MWWRGSDGGGGVVEEGEWERRGSGGGGGVVEEGECTKHNSSTLRLR